MPQALKIFNYRSSHFFIISFGDFVPGKNTLETEKKGVAALCTLYLLVGKSLSNFIRLK